MIPVLGTLWVAVLLTVLYIVLHRAARDPQLTSSGAVLVDLCLGLAAVAAIVFWFSGLLQIFF